ncbi:MAG: hypothetical protein R2688_05070 [Fimbriimonadaceae bacterium]
MSESEQPKDKQTQKKLDRALLKRIIHLFVPHKKMVFLTVIAVMVGVVLGIAPPFLIKVIIDEGIVGENLGIIAKFSAFILVAVLAGAGMTLLYGYWGVIVGQAHHVRLAAEALRSSAEHVAEVLHQYPNW